MENNIESIIEFLNPYIKGAVVAGDYKAYLFQSILYIMQDNATIIRLDLSTKIDPNLCLSIDSGILLENSYINSFVYQKYIEIQTIISHTNNMVYEDSSLIDDPKFFELANLKASDGAGWYFINTSIATIFIPVFLGLPNIKKQDSVGIRVYHIVNNKFLIRYTVLKKKLGYSYDLYYQILNVNNPLR